MVNFVIGIFILATHKKNKMEMWVGEGGWVNV